MSIRRLMAAAALVALLVTVATVATGQDSRKDRAIDLIRRMIGPFAGLSWMTYDDLDLEHDIVNVRSLMNSEQLSATGLGKLSAGELSALDRWISEFAFDLLRQGREGCSAPIESKIDGEFEGWSGDTIFKLMNGQIWQQASYDYAYNYEYMPDVTIFPSSGGCKMLVEGMDATIEVKKLR